MCRGTVKLYGLAFLAKRVAPNQYFSNPHHEKNSRLEVKPPRPRGPDAGRRRLGPGRTRARGTGPRFRPQVAELVVRHHDDRPQTHTQHLSMLYNVGRCVTIVGGRHGRAQRRRRASACDFPVLDPRPPGPASSRVAGGRRVPRTEAVCAPRVLTPRDPRARPEPAAASSLPASSREQRRRFFEFPSGGVRAELPCS